MEEVKTYEPVTKVKIIGNGPSRDLYRHTGIQYHDGAVCMCNYSDLPNPPFWRDYISIVDRRCMDYLHQNDIPRQKIALMGTIWTTPQLKEQADKWGWHIPVLPVYNKVLMNSAATAAYHATTKFETIEIWGCDSLWSTVTESKVDKYIQRHQRPNNLHNRWRQNWQTVWDTGKQFIICCPEGVEKVDYGSNVEWREFKK
jgi:hypothetical protein